MRGFIRREELRGSKRNGQNRKRRHDKRKSLGEAQTSAFLARTEDNEDGAGRDRHYQNAGRYIRVEMKQANEQHSEIGTIAKFASRARPKSE